MGLISWLQKKIFPKKMKNYLFEQGAYHESGHIIMAYLSGFRSDEVTLILTDPGSGFTKFDYGDARITLLIAAMQNFDDHPNIYNNLDSNLKNGSAQVALKISGILMGGPVSEALYKSGVEFRGSLPIEMAGPDLVHVQSIDLCLSQNIPNHNPNYINESLQDIVRLFKQKESWSAIQHLSNAILNSTDKKLNRQQIEQSLTESGYFEFIK